MDQVIGSAGRHLSAGGNTAVSFPRQQAESLSRDTDFFPCTDADGGAIRLAAPSQTRDDAEVVVNILLHLIEDAEAAYIGRAASLIESVASSINLENR
jgi:hypothetical protein